MFKILLSQFIRQNGRNPNNLEMILLRQKAANQSVDERKVVNMFDREPVNPNKPILGGTNIDETEEQIRQRLIKQNEQGIANLKNKLDDPEKKAMGGRIGYKVGSKLVEGLLKTLQNKFGKKAITTADKAPVPSKTLERDMFKTADNRINKKEGVFMEDGKTPDYDYYKEILDDAEDSMGFNVAGDETIEELLKREKTLKDYEAEMFAEYKSIGGSKRLGGPNDPMADAIDNASPGYTGDIKYDAQLVADDLAEKMFQMEYDDLTQAQQMDLYDKAYTSLSKQRGEFQKISKPEKTLQSMKEGKGIDMSDPEIADEFGRFMKEKDPKGYKELEQKIELSNFNPKGRKKNADGGIMRAPFVGGGMGRRGFLKLLGSVGAGAAALKTGILGLGGKQATKEVAKEVATSSGGVPPYFFKLVKKIKNLGDDVTQTASTQERQRVTKYKDYELTEDAVTGRQEIQRQKVKLDDDAADYYGNPLTEETYMSYSPGERIFQETAEGRTKIIKTNPEYEEGTALIRSDREFAGDVVDESFKISDDVIEEAMSEAPSIRIKKASGGIARMLGE